MANIFDSRNTGQRKYDRWAKSVVDTKRRFFDKTDDKTTLNTDGTTVLSSMATLVHDRTGDTVTAATSPFFNKP